MAVRDVFKYAFLFLKTVVFIYILRFCLGWINFFFIINICCGAVF